MLFVPLPLIATLLLTFLLVRFVLARDMTVRAHQLFASVIALYAVQSLLSSLRWGYGLPGTALPMAVLAPILPALAYLAYKALSGRQTGWQLWPLAVVVVNWAVYVAADGFADPVILLTYIGFGAVLLRLVWLGADRLTLSPINDAREILLAMGLTGLTLVASGLTDIYVIYDFIRNDGQNTGLVLGLVQTVFVLAIGVSAAIGRATPAPETGAEPPQDAPEASAADADILARIEAIFEREQLHLTEDLSLRRMSRKLGVPDRHVSNAVNRVKQMSVSQYVNSFRIKEACRLLLDTDQTVLEISLAAGFASKSNFNREFSRQTGQTPSQWRAERRG